MAASSNRVTGDAAADDEFSSFAAAERLSDPFGDVYGADADFGDFVGGSQPADSSSLMSFSPLTGPASSSEPPTLLPSISGETDPFADITGGLRQQEKTSTTPSAARAAILDLVWGSSSQETDTNPLAASVGSTSGRSRTASSPSGFTLPQTLPMATKFASFPAAAGEKETGDLLSFSPVQTSTLSDPFFGIEGESKTAFGDDELFTLTATPTTPQSEASSSLRGSFASLHEAVKPPGEVVGEARDPFGERTTRSFGSLNSSFVGAGGMEEHNGTQTSFGAFAAGFADGVENSSVTPRQSPSSAPPSLRSSFKMTDGFLGFAPASAADDSDEVDPFAEAGLAAPEEVPLAEALAAWSSSADPTAEVDGEGTEEKDGEGSVADEEVQDENVGDDQGSVIAAVENVGGVNHATSASLEATALDDWQSVGTATLSPAQPTDEEEPAAGILTTEQGTTNVVAVESPATTNDSRTADEQSFMPFTDSIDHGKTIESNESEAGLVSPTETNEDKFHALGIQDGAFDDDESDSDEVMWPSTQSSADTKDSFELEDNTVGFSAPATDITFGSSDLTHMDSFPGAASSPQHDPLSISPIAAAELSTGTDQLDDNSGREAKDSQEQFVEMDDGDSFGDFGNFEAVVPATSSTKAPNASAAWGSFPSPTHAQSMAVEGDTDSFGDFVVAAPSTAVTSPATAAFEDGGFGNFAQSGETGGDDDFDHFGDFTQGSANDADGFDDFQQSSSPSTFDEDGDGFGDFAPVVTPVTTAAPTISIPLLSKNDLSTFFKEAFPTQPLPTISIDQPESQDEDETNIIREASTDFIQDVFRSMCEEYISIVTATGRQSSSSSGSLSSASEATDGGERVRLGRKTTRASKYIKYVLSEKIQEASRQNGIFPHGSERHQTYMGFTASGDADRMRAALKELQDALFHNSVNDAMMRIAKQAALSAKAKIAEQAAQQQANSRGGSLFSTTRHLLSRGGSAAGTHGPGSSGNDNKADHAGADTPTGASVQKLARFSFTNSHDEAASQRGASSGDERGSEGSDHTGHSSGSDSEAVSSVGDSRTRSQNFSGSGSGSSNGGLMKKFQDRFSFASSRHRPRFVSLRREGQSGEEVRKMELNLDAISGGLDEVKWKCAMFLYDVEEVAHVAPSQISIVAYPSKQPLAGKTDRSALTKLVKPDTVWTVDIGANNSDMLNEW
ncbi:hypothetical protein PR001_g2486 [Phytophthora rubi]|uniref:Uncharacterized protein n=1 Tax=Phytophthora rubi TaxID=129364 RepID=A0A6A3NXD7_9STRA|nr:hypothetical protein PR001_g2486 [Phytophthora rubi]